MKLKYTLAAALVLLASHASAARAEEKISAPVQKSSPIATQSEALQKDPKWIADMARLQKLGASQEDCDERWNILWPQAKKGNLEARAVLYGALFNVSGMLKLPGSTKDLFSQTRDSAIVGVHSVGYVGHPEIAEDLERFYLRLSGVFSFLFKTTDKFTECAKEKKSHDCAKIAVDAHLVPIFDDFAEQVDMAIAQGKKAECF